MPKMLFWWLCFSITPLIQRCYFLSIRYFIVIRANSQNKINKNETTTRSSSYCCRGWKLLTIPVIDIHSPIELSAKLSHKNVKKDHKLNLNREQTNYNSSTCHTRPGHNQQNITFLPSWEKFNIATLITWYCQWSYRHTMVWYRDHCSSDIESRSCMARSSSSKSKLIISLAALLIILSLRSRCLALSSCARCSLCETRKQSICTSNHPNLTMKAMGIA